MAPFMIKCCATGYVLDIKDNVDETGAEIVMWTEHGGDNQLWKYKDGMIHSVKAPGKVLDIDEKNGKIVLYPAHGGANQKWKFGGDGTIVSETGKAIDVDCACTENGTPIIPYDLHGRENQVFRVVFA